jgi:hypothetical protein
VQLNATGDVPATDVVRPWNFTVVAELSRGKIRIETEAHLLNPSVGDLRPSSWVYVFDGGSAKVLKNAAAGQVGASSTVSLYNTAAADPFFVLSQELPVLLGHGYVPSTPNVCVTSLLKRSKFATDFQIAGEATFGDAQRCLVLRSLPEKPDYSFREYWVDPARGGAVVRMVQQSKGFLWSTIEIVYEKATRGWLPQRWTCYQYLPGTKGAVSQRFDFKVKNRLFDLAPADAEFDIPLAPGMLVDDQRDEQSSKLYRVAKDGRRLLSVTDCFMVPDERRSGLFYWVLGVLGIGALLGLGRRIFARTTLRKP